MNKQQIDKLKIVWQRSSLTSVLPRSRATELPLAADSNVAAYRWAWADANGPGRVERREGRVEEMATAFVQALPMAWTEGKDLFVVPDRWTKQGYGVLVSDMDSTLIEAESLDELADSLGVGQAVAEITALSMGGSLDFSQALEQRFQLIKGVHRDQFIKLGETTALSAGADACIASLVASGTHCTLATGGFDIIAARVIERLGMQDFVANQLAFDEAGGFMGRLASPVLDADAKLKTLKEKQEAFGRGSPCLAMGDGANDLAMIDQADIGVAYRGKAIVREATAYQLNYATLQSLPWLLGV